MRLPWRQHEIALENQIITFKSYFYSNSLNSLVRKCDNSAKMIVCFLLIVLMAHGVQSIAGNWKQISYKANFEVYEQRAEKINNLACGRSDVALAYYPGEPIMYFFTKMPTVSKYFYMYPWVAEVGLSDVINRLKSDTAVVYLAPGQVLRYKNKDYLAKIKKYLDKNYKQLEDFYLSPSLIRDCHSK